LERKHLKKLTKNLSDISIHRKIKIPEGKSTAMSVIGRKMVWVKNVDKWANRTEQGKDFKHI
jgi:hypothetical protein